MDNRRDLWRNSQGLDGDHASWALWNEHVLHHVMPRLYADSVRWLISDAVQAGDFGSELREAEVFKLWPSLGSFKDRAWKHPILFC